MKIQIEIDEFETVAQAIQGQLKSIREISFIDLVKFALLLTSLAGFIISIILALKL